MAKLFQRDDAASRRKPRGAPGKRCYAIGDIHGRIDLLDALLEEIRRHHTTQRRACEAVVVVLGDMIDRGPASREVVERLMQGLSFEAQLICLRGNHEDMLLKSLRGDETSLRKWLDLGGTECALSYGLSPKSLVGQPPAVIAHNLSAAIPRSHVAFLSACVDSVRFGDYLFVHAGLRPGVPLEKQSTEDLRWIRKGFLESSADHGCVVVHGHSVSLEVEERANRIGIDTGAYRTGVLTAIWLEDDDRGFLEAREKGSSLAGTAPVG
jgi:serine/threonine protein phosphatase 1